MLNFGTFVKVFATSIRFSTFNCIFKLQVTRIMENNECKIDIHVIEHKLRPFKNIP
jgi:hypothetical protein